MMNTDRTDGNGCPATFIRNLAVQEAAQVNPFRQR